MQASPRSCTRCWNRPQAGRASVDSGSDARPHRGSVEVAVLVVFGALRGQLERKTVTGQLVRGDQRWSIFLCNHANAIVACDFLVAVTATFRLLYVFVVIEHGSRRLVRVAVTAHPSAAWTLQQLREVVGFDRARRYLIHDRDSIFARSLDESIRSLGMTVLKSPPHSPTANAICERVIGTIRRECLDWLIPLSESHLRSILRSWVGHYNRGRPHMTLGPGVQDPPSKVVPSATPLTRHRIGQRLGVRARSVLRGLHHEYLLAPASA